jgi:ubiquinone/menaquinone biosynthesis C-methylase UbiE
MSEALDGVRGPPRTKAGLEHWEKYYRGGGLASCPLGTDRNYTLELRDAWVSFFSGLPDSAHILDIGTGNGALALFALEAAAAAGRRFEIHGTDLALIDPARHVPDGARLFAGVQFHAQVATEELPFEESSFDAVSGQYSLEYTQTDRALGEIHRILKVAGRAQFILHHADSIVARKARLTLEQSKLILETTGILRKLRRHVEAEARSRARAQKTAADLAADLEVLVGAARQSDNPLLLKVTIDAVHKLLAERRHLSTAALGREIDRFEADVRASAHRLQDLVRCGQTEAGMQHISEQAQAQGFRIAELARQHHAGTVLVGWRLVLEKA